MESYLNKKFFQDVFPEHCFWCCDGQIIKNLLDFDVVLKKMSSATYKYHANLEKNDFSQWIEEVIGDKVLANNLRKSKSKANAMKYTSNRIKELSSVVGKNVSKKKVSKKKASK